MQFITTKVAIETLIQPKKNHFKFYNSSERKLEERQNILN